MKQLPRSPSTKIQAKTGRSRAAPTRQCKTWRRLLSKFDQRRARKRPLSRLTQPFDGRFVEARLGEVVG